MIGSFNQKGEVVMFFCADRQKVFAVFLFSGFLLLGGCGRQEKAEGLFEDREVASVNDYKIIVSDFKTAVNPVLEYEKVGESDWVAKDAILDNLITKKLLIMEAQNQGLDRDRVFMKEVERFWEQSLVKLLLKKKGREFATHISVSEDEMRQEYERRKRQDETVQEPFEAAASDIKQDLLGQKYEAAYEEWLEGLRKKVVIKTNSDILKKLDLKALRGR